ncbi:hypothetical protein yc1106_09794 [Curvularia clavata]|uniref:Uncharacterized protein n=1 Tax=Curvularia clavata TaxID=95742 RepID=A0A9Q8ZIV2_CURCL|nr:hypothetical protein yc1106_09794 [Curvularia clavata]
MDSSTTKKGATNTSWPSTATVVSPPPKSPLSPCSPDKTAELWDRYEKLALEKATERDQLNNRRSEQYHGLPSRTKLDSNSSRRHTAMPSTTASICKTCQHPITYASGICERCIKTIVVLRKAGETTPPLSPTESTTGFTDAGSPSQATPRSEVITPSYSSPKRPSFCPLPSHAAPALLNRCKKSPSEPSQPSLHLDTTSPPYTTRSQVSSPPMTPTSPHYASPVAPPTAHSICSTRRSSLANVTMVPKPAYLHVRNDSGTPSEFSTLYQTISTATTPPGSLHRFGYPLQNATSVWDDWDTEEEEEEEPEVEADRAGISSWMGRRKGKARGGKPSLEQSVEGACGEGEQSRTEGSVRIRGGSASVVTEKVRKPSGIIRALSCGCGAE